jgi:ribosomal protein S18 acetylase RimI-like enzyme
MKAGVLVDKKFVYAGDRFPEPSIAPVGYDSTFFQNEIEMESELFYELRKRNGIEPARIGDSSPQALEEIERFFLANKNTFYFLFHENGDLIGSALHLGNFIQSLAVAKKYQRQGYGAMLTRYCVNRILDAGYSSVELRVLEGNSEAEKLYKKLGFKESD